MEKRRDRRQQRHNKIEELNEVLKHTKNRKSCELDNLPMELWKFGGNELRIQLLERIKDTITRAV